MISAMFSIPTDTYCSFSIERLGDAGGTHAYEIRGDARRELLFRTQLLMCSRRRMDDQRLRVAFTGYVSAMLSYCFGE